jgi:DNA replication and repair protein RecF
VRLEHVRLADFRNYESLAFDPQPGLNVFAGPNAQGKSNLLEALAMLGTGKSFRAHRESDLIRSGATRAEIGGEARIAAGQIRLRCTLTLTPAGTRKSFAVNGGAVGFARYLGRTRVVTFVPADLQLASGGPALRRAFLNGALAQLSPSYYHDLALYGKIVQQKAALLRGAIAPDRELLLAYNDELVPPATALIAARRERLTLTYAPNPEGDVAAALTAQLEAEIRRRTTLVGPHRDDLRLLVDGKPIAAFGSQGQQRTAVLALKVAEYDVMRERSGEAPILLLDDVLSELDAERAGGFLAAVEGFEQAFLTTTDVPRDLGAAATWSIEAATLTPC